MAKNMMINLNDHFMDNDKRPLIIIGDKTYPVDDTFTTAEKWRKLRNSGKSNVDELYKLAFGDENAAEILGLNLRLYNWNLLNLTLLGIYNGYSQEEIEDSFRKLEEPKESTK